MGKFIDIRSFAFKTAFIYFLIFLLGLGLVGFLLLRYSSQNILESAESNIVHRGEIVKIKIDEYLDDLHSHILFMSKNPNLLLYIEEPSALHYDLLSAEYLALIRSKPDFSQIRFISAVDYGMEKVRVDRKGDDGSIISKDSLQNKADRLYFTETLLLSEDETYFSQIDLNRDFGKISVPHIPTLRVAKSIWSDGVLQGVIVINTNLSKLFATLKKAVDVEYALRLINKDGYYIMHEYADSTFIFDLKSDLDISPQVTDLQRAKMEKTLITGNEDELISYNTISLPSVNYDLDFLVVADKSKVLGSYYKWRRDTLLIVLIIGIICMLLSFFVIKKQSQRLSQITKKLSDFPTRHKVKDLPIHRDDEIGDLSRSLVKMSDIVNDQISSLETARLKAEKAESDKTEFIENISHEIRNPLQSIMGLGSMLENNNPNSNQLDIINSLKFNTSNLQGLVNNILDFQSIIKGDLKFVYDWDYIPAIINEVVMGHKYSAVEKGISIEVVNDLKLSKFQQKIERLRLSQILSNLISNAIKFTDKGGKISITTEVTEIKNDQTRVKVEVKDNGLGMTADQLLKIKERYFTNKGLPSMNSSHGLGLTIVNQLLNYLQSSLMVTSQKDKGSSFSFELVTSIRENLKVDNHEAESLNLLGSRVLVIEDDQQILNLYQHIFESARSEIIYISDLEKAVLKTAYFDLIITDFRLSGTTAADYKNKIMEALTDKGTLVLVSALDPNRVDIKSHFPESHFIQKPFSNTDFINQINRGIVTTFFGYSSVESIKKDYDYDRAKYEKALRIMAQEWKSMRDTLCKAILERDLSLFDQVLHKMITTLKRLELTAFYDWLVNRRDDLENQDRSVVHIADDFKFIMNNYLEIINASD